MPKQLDYTLSETELNEIQQAMKHRDTRVSKRATIVHSLHLGHHPTDVARTHNVSVASVYNHFNRYKSEGVEGLGDKARSGRPKKSNADYIQLLEETLETNPKTLGYAFTIWTQARLRQYLAEQTDIKLSRSVFQDLMHELGYRYRRPKRDMGHQQDPILREQVKQALDEVKKEPKPVMSSYSLWTKVPLD